MLKNLNIRTKLFLILGINIALFVFMGFAAKMGAGIINDEMEIIYGRDLRGISYLLEADRDLHQALVAERTMFIAKPGTELFNQLMDDYTSNKEQADTRVGKFADISDSPSQKKLVQKYMADRKKWDEVSLEVVRNLQAGNHDDAVVESSIRDGIKRFDAMRDHIDKITGQLNEQAVASYDQAADTYSKLSYFLLFLTLGSALVGSFCTLLVTNNITHPLRAVVESAGKLASGSFPAPMKMDRKDEVGVLADSFDDMSSTLQSNLDEIAVKSREAEEKAEAAEKAMIEAEEARAAAENAKKEGMNQAAMQLEQIVSQIASASEELNSQIRESQRGSEAQRTRTSEAATAMEEMNATVLEVAANASSAAENARNAHEQAQEGGNKVQSVAESIEELNEESKRLQKEMQELGEHAESIGKIMEVISDIADQTNLLALNAAIEAARAGEAGRGFAVVADEVRKLAEKTMTATQEVGNAINAIQGSARNSIRSMDRNTEMVVGSTELSREAGLFLTKIQTFVDETADQVRAIATAAEQQSASSEEINRSTEEINTISADIAEAMDQSAQAMDDMAQLSDELRMLIDELKQ